MRGCVGFRRGVPPLYTNALVRPWRGNKVSMFKSNPPTPSQRGEVTLLVKYLISDSREDPHKEFNWGKFTKKNPMPSLNRFEFF